MPKRLKAYQTSVGFFDVVIAAPSMKAAAEAWGIAIEEFRRGFAKQSDDPEIVSATMAKPGVVLKRPVGSSGAFTENPELPRHLLGTIADAARKTKPKKKTAKPRANPDVTNDRAAAHAFEREQRRREKAREKEEVAREKQRRIRERAIAKAETVLDQASRQHDAKVKQIERRRAALESRSQREEARWEKQKEKLEDAVRRARD